MDGVRIEDVASSPGGGDGFPDAIEASLKARRDRPRAARRVTIPKADGGERPLGIPSVRDRVVEGGGEAGSGADLRGGLHGVFSRLSSGALGDGRARSDPRGLGEGMHRHL